MVQCSNTIYGDFVEEIDAHPSMQCDRTATVEVSGYISNMPITGEVGYTDWYPSCVDCFSEILHEGPQQDGGNNQDGWCVRWISQTIS